MLVGEQLVVSVMYEVSACLVALESLVTNAMSVTIAKTVALSPYPGRLPWKIETVLHQGCIWVLHGALEPEYLLQSVTSIVILM